MHETVSLNFRVLFIRLTLNIHTHTVTMKKKVATRTQLSRRLSFLSILFHKLINAVGVIILLLLLVLVSRPRLLLHPQTQSDTSLCVQLGCRKPAGHGISLQDV